MKTLLIGRTTVSSLLGISECMTAVEEAFKAWATGRAATPAILGVHASGGGFHIKAGILNLSRRYFVAKLNANFPDNGVHQSPTIQGVIAVCDAANGRLLALMDSMEVTTIRTGAATGVAAKYLSRKEASVLAIAGCGNQGAISVKTICAVRPIRKIFLFDVDRAAAEGLARQISSEFNADVEVVSSFSSAAMHSDIIITCTPSRSPILAKANVRPGTFIAAVGADSETKRELDPQVLASAKLVTDSTDQCATIGDLHHAIAAGVITRDHVHAQLGEVIAGLKSGRTSAEEVIVFDSTGTGLQDVAAAAIVYERAEKDGLGKVFEFGG